MEKRTLILTIDWGNAPSWHQRALGKQLQEWVEANQVILPMDNLIIFAAPGDTRLFWLEAKTDTDKKTLEELRDKMKPILEVSFGIKPNNNYVDPFKKAIQNLREHREKNGK